ncbi:MAG: WG repeat-containing protein [Alistipes sp.]|nr:WG repeat-containing protein [Alistipes sp.]
MKQKSIFRSVGNFALSVVKSSAIICLCFIVIGLICVAVDKRNERKTLSWMLSHDIEVRNMSRGQFRLYDISQKRYVSGRLDWVVEAGCDPTTAVYSQNNRRGYLSTATGEVIIDANKNNYTHAWVFSEGKAAVVKDGMLGFIDIEGKEVIPFIFPFSENVYDMIGPDCMFHNGYCILTYGDYKMGIIDTTGNWVVEPVYDEIYQVGEYKYYFLRCGESRTLVDGTTLAQVLPSDLDNIQYKPDQGFILTKNGKKWMQDFEGNVILPFMYDYWEYLYYPSSAPASSDSQYVELLSDYAAYHVGQGVGILYRHTGKPITPAIYDYVEMVSPHIFSVCYVDQEEEFLIDHNGNIVNR